MSLVLPRLYVILDAGLITTSHLEFAEQMAKAGVRLLQYRGKMASSGELLRNSRELAEFCSAADVTFLVNDRSDVALLAGANGVHVGQDDLSVDQARAILGIKKWIGVSTHNLEQFRRAEQSSADYIAVGPIFSTETKDNPGAVVGTELLRQVRPLTKKPIVAIGGITLERAKEVIEAGADSAAVISGITRAYDPMARARLYMEALEAAKPAAGN
ncbi:MAG: thiamine phosphate synthase [Candidatus Acidiferrum sp.]